MEIATKLSRLQELRDVMEGVPEEHINLASIHQTFDGGYVELERADEVHPCDSIFCIVGLAWVYPPFVEAGIRRRSNPVGATWQFFGQGFELTCCRNLNDYDGDLSVNATDKEVALARIDRAIYAARDELDMTARAI